MLQTGGGFSVPDAEKDVQLLNNLDDNGLTMGVTGHDLTFIAKIFNLKNFFKAFLTK